VGEGVRESDSLVVRDAVVADLPSLLEIYNEVIANSTAVFSDQPVTLEERERWLQARHADGFPVLVAVDGDEVVGFGSFGPFRTWPGYLSTVEHSVHVRADRRGGGIGSLLLAELIERARALGKHVIIAGIEAENAASMRLHARLGFEPVARLSEVARKFDRWLDLVFMQLTLS
jgi:phosphinothricin acetyltransferase